MKRKRDESIFARQRVTPNQAREVALRRYEDARCLESTGLNKHANGAMYLGGYAVECLLKARLLEKHPDLRYASPAALSREDRWRWSLVFERHDLDLLLAALPDVRREIELGDPSAGRWRVRLLQSICATWTVFARYSPLHATIRDAREFLDSVKELRPWLL